MCVCVCMSFLKLFILFSFSFFLSFLFSFFFLFFSFFLIRKECSFFLILVYYLRVAVTRFAIIFIEEEQDWENKRKKCVVQDGGDNVVSSQNNARDGHQGAVSFRFNQSEKCALSLRRTLFPGRLSLIIHVFLISHDLRFFQCSAHQRLPPLFIF